MVVLKSRSGKQVKKDAGNTGNKENKKAVKYVWLSSNKAIFLATADAKESKYSVSVPIIPLHGLYYSSKDKQKYTSKELSDYFVILNVKKDDQLVYYLRKGVVVIIGYSEDNLVIVSDENGENNDSDS
ncbi:conserved hypothetical protein [Sulfolobus islandicus L.S.2.15]|uniref:Uncharacterized protein n=1 Tax=Saccharolobus islandicus (strain L.S.2.15 / Lassen \|nr:hypothetical protein [Sulfolobus islandicus]ACP35455.1 conserved hypothetical protein [Sulfolobus islandicus L.S.2.15]